MHISKNNGGHNSKTLSTFSPLKRKTIFSILAIFKSHLLSKIIISEKKPFAQHFMYIESLIWLHSHPLLEISTNPNVSPGTHGVIVNGCFHSLHPVLL